MSYENPRIVVDKSGMILAEGIANLGKYTAQGITNYYANRERIQKENEKKDSAIAAVTVDEYEKTQKQLTDFEQGYSGLAGYNKVKDLYENSLRNGEKATIRLKTTTDLNEINELKKIINSENKFRNNATGVLKKLAADASTVNDPLGVGKEFGFAGNGEEEKLITQYSLNTILGGPGSFEANRNGDLLNINFSGNINGKSYAKEINGENYVNSPFGMTYKVANLSQEGADAVNASLLKKNGEINPTNIIGTKIIDAPLEVINRSGGKIKEVGATMPIEIINVDDILIARQAEIKAQSFYSSLSPSQQEDVFNKSFNFASPTITPNGFSSFEDFTNKTKTMAPAERVNIIKAALEQTILDDTLRGAGIGTYIDAETQQNVYYRQSGPIKPKSIDKKDTSVAPKKTASEIKEERRFENLGETEKDINLLFRKLPVKRNPAGLYIGKIDMNDIGIQDKIINSGFSISSVTAKQTQEEKDDGEEPQVIGYKLKPEGKASTAAFEVLLNVTPQKLMEKMLLSKGATAKEAKEKSYTAGFIPPNVEEDKYSQYKQE